MPNPTRGYVSTKVYILWYTMGEVLVAFNCVLVVVIVEIIHPPTHGCMHVIYILSSSCRLATSLQTRKDPKGMK
jgi:hypothetical protein